jgi:hypothetical protein
MIEKNLTYFCLKTAYKVFKNSGKKENNNGQAELDLINSLNESKSEVKKQRQEVSSSVYSESQESTGNLVPTTSSASSISMSKEIVIEVSSDLKSKQQQQNGIVKEQREKSANQFEKQQAQFDADLHTPTNSFPYTNASLSRAASGSQEKMSRNVSVDSNYCNLTEEEEEEDAEALKSFETENASECNGKNSSKRKPKLKSTNRQVIFNDNMESFFLL